jgi:hypothetical protein
MPANQPLPVDATGKFSSTAVLQMLPVASTGKDGCVWLDDDLRSRQLCGDLRLGKRGYAVLEMLPVPSTGKDGCVWLDDDLRSQQLCGDFCGYVCGHQ